MYINVFIYFGFFPLFFLLFQVNEICQMSILTCLLVYMGANFLDFIPRNELA